MPFSVTRGDIARIYADAIVLPANMYLQEGRGTSHSIFMAAGRKELEEACSKIGYCELGSAVITEGFNLRAKYIIHAVNPKYIDGTHHEEELLYKTYISAMELAAANGLESIAFPLLSSGNYGYPRGAALDIANRAISDFLARDEASSEMLVRLIICDRNDIRRETEMYDDVRSFVSRTTAAKLIIDGSGGALFESHRSYAEPQNSIRRAPKQSVLRSAKESMTTVGNMPMSEKQCDEATAEFDFAEVLPASDRMPENFIDLINGKKTFHDMLMKYIIESEMTNPQIYVGANMSRKTFSKIYSGDVIPRKESVLALAIALKLPIEETEDLLARAGYAFVESDVADAIVRYFIAHGNYNIMVINELLFEYGQKLLGNSVA